jgi:hypothetical protein
LLDWHRDWYVKDDPKKWATGRSPVLYQGHGGDWRLTTTERKRILLNNIYGVDIDSQAVEVTKLSLLLKVLEGENEETLNRQFKLFHERALPDLGNNIKCGNSLIGPDFYKNQQMSLLDEEERYRINVFDWEAEFLEIMKSGGFDVVIGNPPYGSWFQANEAIHFRYHYEVFSDIRDVYACFIEKGINLLADRGKLSYIVPSAWIGGPAYNKLRSLLLRYQIETIVMLPFDVFTGAYVDTAIVVVSNQTAKPTHIVQTYVFGKREKLLRIDIPETHYQQIKQKDWELSKDNKFILNPETISLLHKLKQNCLQNLDDVVLMKRGVLFDKSLLMNKRESNQCHPYFEGDVYRYTINMVVNRWVEFGDKMKERPKEFHWFEGERILLRRLVNRRQRLMAALTKETFITNKNLYTVLVRNNSIDIHLLLGVLNSKLLSFLYVRQVTQAVKDDFPQVTIKDILSLPFPSISAIAPYTKRMVELVEQILLLHKQLSAAKTTHDKTTIQRQIDATDQQIDQLVYELYGLTDEEIRIIEGETTKT